MTSLHISDFYKPSLDIIYKDLIYGSGTLDITLDVSTGSHVLQEIRDLVECLRARLNVRILAIRDALQVYPEDERETLVLSSPARQPVIRDARRLAAAIAAFWRLSDVLRRPEFASEMANAESSSFSEFMQSTRANMVDMLLSAGYVTQIASSHETHFAQRWAQSGSEEAVVMERVSYRLEAQVQLLYGGTAQGVIKALSRGMFYRRHMWANTQCTPVMTDDGIDYSKETDIGVLLKDARNRRGMWRVIESMLTVAAVLSVEAGFTESSRVWNVKDLGRDDHIVFTLAACISPLTILTPFAVRSDIASELPVHQVSI